MSEPGIPSPGSMMMNNISIVTEFTVTWTMYKINTYYNFKVAALNGVGLGYYSDWLLHLTDNVPTYMYPPVNDTATTNATYIRITWRPVLLETETGRDPVIYYRLEWDQGGSNSSYTLPTGAPTTLGPIWQELTTPNISVLEFS